MMDRRVVEAFLCEYSAWCERQIATEVASGLQGLAWIGDDYVSLALKFLSQAAAPSPADFLRARLHVSLASRYAHLGAEQAHPAESERAQVRLFEEFVRAALDDLAKTGWRIARPGARKPRSVARKLRAISGMPFEEERGVGLVCAEYVEPFFLRTYLTADSRGFAYWHDLANEEDGRAVFRESYRSWFGLGWNTQITRFEDHKPLAIAEFILEKIQRYRKFLHEISTVDFVS